MSVRVAVIGVGALGKHHARILAELPGAELVGVVDINDARAREIAELEAQRRQLKAAKLADAWSTTNQTRGSNYGDWGIGISAAAEFLGSVLD